MFPLYPTPYTLHPTPSFKSEGRILELVRYTIPSGAIEAFQFNPPEVLLKKGGSVTFINKDSTPHTVTSEQGAKFQGTGRLSKNESKKVVFNQVGSQNYFCEIHPSMKGKVIVVQ